MTFLFQMIRLKMLLYVDIVKKKKKNRTVKIVKVQTWKLFSRICGKISHENYP